MHCCPNLPTFWVFLQFAALLLKDTSAATADASLVASQSTSKVRMRRVVSSTYQHASDKASLSKTGEKGILDFFGNAWWTPVVGVSADSDTKPNNVFAVPGEGDMQDEAFSAKSSVTSLAQSGNSGVAMARSRMRTPSFVSKTAENYGGASSGLIIPDRGWQTSDPIIPTKSQVSAPIAEFDEVRDAAPAMEKEVGVPGAGEEDTKEDLDRQQRGDVTGIEKAGKSPLKRTLPTPRHVLIAQHTARHDALSAADLEAGRGLPPGPDKMTVQCLAFATWVKGQGAKGVDLVRMWKGTCSPAVAAGAATPQYATMCNALGGAVEQFAVNDAWTPAAACEAVVRTFRESGIGASPLMG